MRYDYKKLLKAIVDAVEGPGSFTSRMTLVIDECEAQRPHPHWSLMRTLDYDEKTAKLRSWIEGALSEQPTGFQLKGLWFGLNNPMVNGEATADIYVAGSSKFDEGIGWASETEFFPERGYFDSDVLAKIYAVAYATRDGLGNDAEYPLVLAYGAMLARAALEWLAAAPALQDLEGAAVGFDSGDFLSLGGFENQRFKTAVRVG